MNFPMIKHAIKNKLFIGCEVSDHEFDNLPMCKGCALGKIVRRKFPKKATKRNLIFLEVVSFDIATITKPCSAGGHKYFIIFVDHMCNWKWVYCLQQRHHAMDAIKKFEKEAARASGCKIGTLRCDGEFDHKNAYREWCLEEGIRTEYSVPYSSAQNGKAERAIRTVVEAARTALVHSRMPKNWYWAVKWLVYTINRLPTKSNKDWVSPYHMRWGAPAQIQHLRPFGCEVVVCLQVPEELPRGHKFHQRGVDGYFLGYPGGIKSFTVMVRSTGRIVTRRNVIFNETAI